jgi:hypothetical protein
MQGLLRCDVCSIAWSSEPVGRVDCSSTLAGGTCGRVGGPCSSVLAPLSTVTNCLAVHQDLGASGAL